MLHARDRGPLINLGKWEFNNALNVRVGDASRALQRVASLPAAPLRKLQPLHSKALSKALHVVETAEERLMLLL
eukprot:14066035-Alexandrium_andersonii.AAC.1